MSLDSHDPDLLGLEAALAALVPMPGQVNRDVLLYRAGQASVRGRRWDWPWTTAALGLVAGVLAVIVVFRPAPPPVERVVVVTIREPAPPAPPSADPTLPPPAAESSPGDEIAGGGSLNYVQLQKQVMRWGLDGVPSMPEAPPSFEPPVTRDSLLGAGAEPVALPKVFPLGSFFQ
jgi:hypothetical protein